MYVCFFLILRHLVDIQDEIGVSENRAGSEVHNGGRGGGGGYRALQMMLIQDDNSHDILFGVWHAPDDDDTCLMHKW